MAKKKSSLSLNVGIGIGATFAIVAVLVFVPLESLFITTTPEDLENIEFEVPDAEKLGTASVVQGAPALFQESSQNPLEILYDELSAGGIGNGVTEKFLIAPKVILLDANQEQQLFETTLIIEPLDPRTTVQIPPELVEPESVIRFFINDDFSRQLNAEGTKYHQWTGWEKFIEGNHISPSWQFSRTCGQIAEHNDGCLKMTIHRDCIDTEDFKCPAFQNGLYGFFKVADISDWTFERPLKIGFDYSVQDKQRNIEYLARINNQQFVLDPVPTGHFEVDATDILCQTTSQGVQCVDTVSVVFGLNPKNNDHVDGTIFFNNAFVSGPSVVKKEAINILEQLSLFIRQLTLFSTQGDILDLGFIQVSVDGITVNPNERVVLEGVMEIRLDDKTVNTSRLSATGFTSSVTNNIQINIEGRPTLAFSLDDENFEDGFHDFKIIFRDIIVNIGEGTNTRTFEYHKSFVAYILEFNFNGDQFVAFGEDNRAISVFKNDSTLKTCGLTQGLDSTEPEVKPPVVQVLEQGFTIITTNPNAGKFERDNVEKTNRIYCSLYPNIPRDTNLLFKVNEEFFEVSSPASQKNWDVTCNRMGCTSNFGYSEVFN
jgi:hypothetical protein